MYKPVTECGRKCCCGGDAAAPWWSSFDACVSDARARLVLPGLKLLVLVELASDATQSSALTARQPVTATAAFDVEETALGLNDGL